MNGVKQILEMRDINEEESRMSAEDRRERGPDVLSHPRLSH